MSGGGGGRRRTNKGIAEWRDWRGEWNEGEYEV